MAARRLIPLLDRVLVKRIEPPTKSIGGILLPESSQTKLNQGTVLSVGPGRRDADGKLIAMDKNDPLYDQTEEGKYILSSSNGSDNGPKDASAYDPVTDSVVYGPLLTLAEFKLRLGDAIKEYFDSADADEVISSIEEMKCKEYHPEVVKRAISLSLDEGPRERELIGRLLTCLHPYPLKDADVEKGFEILLDSLDDLCIDIPDAKEMIGCFLARAIVDEVIPPAFISNRNNSHPGDGVVERALSLLSREHCTARLEKVWGPGDGRPVSELKEVIDQLVEVRVCVCV